MDMHVIWRVRLLDVICNPDRLLSRHTPTHLLWVCYEEEDWYHELMFWDGELGSCFTWNAGNLAEDKHDFTPNRREFAPLSRLARFYAAAVGSEIITGLNPLKLPAAEAVGQFWWTLPGITICGEIFEGKILIRILPATLLKCLVNHSLHRRQKWVS